MSGGPTGVRPIPHGRCTPVGPEKIAAGVWHLRVWAPKSPAVSVECLSPAGEVIETVALAADTQGYHAGPVAPLTAGSLYRFRLNSGTYPDPASRFQPQGPHGPSQIPESNHVWTDGEWRGRKSDELVLYELHLGTFSAEGTWAGAARELAELAQLGITGLEIMPVAEFAGKFGWGYDGVALYAPFHGYGTPDDARRFIDEAHRLGLAVILDVVYNHFGPEGNYFSQFSSDYFSERYRNEWGQPLNFDGDNAGPVREYFIGNARYWIEEFHFDGLRFDATQQIFDASPRHLLAEMADELQSAAGPRQLFLVAENECQETRLLRPTAEGGMGLDAIWNDDFHHAARVAATGRRDAYYGDYLGQPQEFVSIARRGFLFQGQWNHWQQKKRGTPTDGLHARNFVLFLQNHDQVANGLRGERLHQQTSPARLRALTAVMLLFPGIPLLFQGQEFAASTPFLYFADLNAELQTLVAKGRHGFLRQFRSVDAAIEAGFALDLPHAKETFARCRLDFSERERHAPIYRLHADLLRLRRSDPALAAAGPVDGAVLGPAAFVLRYQGDGGRLLLVNLGADLRLNPAPEPLLAPPPARGWRLAWSSEDPIYGGGGTPAVETTANWLLPAECTVLLTTDEPRELPTAKLSEKD